MQEVRPLRQTWTTHNPSGRNPASFTSRARLGTDAITPSFVEVRPELHSLFTDGLHAQTLPLIVCLKFRDRWVGKTEEEGYVTHDVSNCAGLLI